MSLLASVRLCLVIFDGENQVEWPFEHVDDLSHWAFGATAGWAGSCVAFVSLLF